MPRHEFRTIEEFVSELERCSANVKTLAVQMNDKSMLQGFYAGKADTYDYVLDVLRNSNLGIVYPPEGK